MKKHLTDGELRAALDGELEVQRLDHLSTCAGCQERQAQIKAESQQTARLLAFLAPAEEPVPSAQSAWNRFSQHIMIKKETSMFKRWFSYPMVRFGTAALVVLALILTFPATRAMAGELLNLFRVQQVTVVQMDFTGLEQLTGDGMLGNQFTELISFEPRGPQTARNLGSGVVIDAKRHVLTNEHVVARASRIRVATADGREFHATLVGADPNNDLAVLRLDTDEKLPWVPLGSSGDLMVGEPVIAIGNPFGFSNSVTTGVISALDRSLNARGSFAFHGLLQTDAAINPGNSGGPLVDLEGRVVGINSRGQGRGIGFTIPVDTVLDVLAQISDGGVSRGWLGVAIQPLDRDLAKRPTLSFRRSLARRGPSAPSRFAMAASRSYRLSRCGPPLPRREHHISGTIAFPRPH